MAATIKVATLVTELVAETENFSRGLSGAIQGAKNFAAGVGKAVLGAAKVVAGAAVAMGAAFIGAGIALGKLAMEAAPLEGIGIAFESMAGRVGLSLDALRTAAAGTISDFDLMKQANTALIGAGEQLGQEFGKALPGLLEAARAAARATGQDVDFLFQSLVGGIKRSSPMLIDNTGLVIKLGEANQKLADELGISVTELSAEQKQIALLNATLEAGEKLTAEFGGGQLTAAERMAQFKAQIQNTKDQIGIALLSALSSVMSVLGNLASDVLPLVVSFIESSVVPAIGKLVTIFDMVVTAFREGENPVRAFINALREIGLDDLADKLQAVFVDGASRIAEFWAIAQPIIADVAQWLSINIPIALEALRSVWAEVWPFIQGQVAEVIAWVQANLPLMQASGSALADFFQNNFLPALQFVWEMVKTIISTAIDIILNIITLAMQVITGDWTAAWTTIQTILITVAAAILSLMENLFNTIATLIGTTMEEIRATWQSNWEMAVLIVTTAWTNIQDAVTSGLVNVINSIQAKVASFRSAGEALMDGLKAGIMAKVQSIISAVRDAVQRAIDAAKSILGARSPSAVFADIGKNMMAGMAIGISANQNLPVMSTLGAVSNTTNVAYNQTMNVNTRATSATVQQDFRTMAALAGA